MQVTPFREKGSCFALRLLIAQAVFVSDE